MITAFLIQMVYCAITYNKDARSGRMHRAHALSYAFSNV